MQLNNAMSFIVLFLGFFFMWSAAFLNKDMLPVLLKILILFTAFIEMLSKLKAINSTHSL